MYVHAHVHKMRSVGNRSVDIDIEQDGERKSLDSLSASLFTLYDMNVIHVNVSPSLLFSSIAHII